MLQFSYKAREVYDAAWRLRCSSSFQRLLDRLLFCGIPVAASIYLWPYWRDSAVALLLLLASLVAWCIAAPSVHRWFHGICVLVGMLVWHGQLPRDGKVQVHCCPQGISWRSSEHSCFISWHKVTGLVLDSEYVYVHCESDSRHWIPVRAFLTPSNVQAFVAECEEHRRLAVNQLPFDWLTLPLIQERRRLRQGLARLREEMARLGDAIAGGESETDRWKAPRTPAERSVSTLSQQRSRLRAGLEALGGEINCLEELVASREKIAS